VLGNGCVYRMYTLLATQRVVPGTSTPCASVSRTLVTSSIVESTSSVRMSESIVLTAHAHG